MSGSAIGLLGQAQEMHVIHPQADEGAQHRDEAGKPFAAQTGVEREAIYAASSVLARQIKGEAPANLFAWGDLEWIDDLTKKHLI